ncbi:MAG TPA: hypothetical protein VE988_15525, partial [Gemmataceae bacterium]|nr:hypothetical protein [Gemmataceae bacterium]
LGIIDPKAPHGYILGIECDGQHYHGTPTARDRDRLRHEVLEKLGWQLHRIWATEWFHRRHQEVERLRDVLAGAKRPAVKLQPVTPTIPKSKPTSPQVTDIKQPVKPKDKIAVRR